MGDSNRKLERPFLSSRILQRRRLTNKWVLYLLVMSVKTGVLGSCGSSQEGYQILNGAEGIFLGIQQHDLIPLGMDMLFSLPRMFFLPPAFIHLHMANSFSLCRSLLGWN